MAGYRTHTTAALLFCGLLFAFPFFHALHLYGQLACVGLAVFFGLFPDVDTKSKGQYVFLAMILVVNGVLIYQEEYKRAAYLGILILLPIMSRHRGWTHSVVAMVLIPGALYLAAVHYSGGSYTIWLPYFLAALFGYASHLAIDRL